MASVSELDTTQKMLLVFVSERLPVTSTLRMLRMFVPGISVTSALQSSVPVAVAKAEPFTA